MAECELYAMYRDGNPVAYRYGEPWVVMQLAMEGGYKTPEEAEKAWLEYKERQNEVKDNVRKGIY